MTEADVKGEPQQLDNAPKEQSAGEAIEEIEALLGHSKENVMVQEAKHRVNEFERSASDLNFDWTARRPFSTDPWVKPETLEELVRILERILQQQAGVNTALLEAIMELESKLDRP